MTEKIKYSVDTLTWMKTFENITKARLKDCFENKNKIYFIVEEGQLRKALGNQSANIAKLEKAFPKGVKIIEHSKDLEKFMINLFYPLKILEVEINDKIIVIKGPDTKTKGLMIGARAQNLRNYEMIAKKYYDIEEIKIV